MSLPLIDTSDEEPFCPLFVSLCSTRIFNAPSPALTLAPSLDDDDEDSPGVQVESEVECSSHTSSVLLSMTVACARAASEDDEDPSPLPLADALHAVAARLRSGVARVSRRAPELEPDPFWLPPVLPSISVCPPTPRASAVDEPPSLPAWLLV